MESRKRSSQTPIEDLEAQIRPGSPGKRQRTSSDHNAVSQASHQRSRNNHSAAAIPQPDESIVARFKQPEDLLGPQICSLCERNITKSVKILCAECGMVAPLTAATQDNPVQASGAKSELVMCLECLRLGKTVPEYPSHLASHEYYVYDNLDFPLLTKEWSALQEIRLIQGIMKCGLGNWTDISEQYLKGAKEPKECETHYFSVLMQQTAIIGYQSALTHRGNKVGKDAKTGDDHKLDSHKLTLVNDMINAYVKMKAEEKEAEDLEFMGSAAQQARENQMQMAGYMEQVPNPKVTSAPLVKQNVHQQMSSQTNVANQQAKQNCQEVLGYLPKRGDFEQEYDMDAELLLADMEFFEDDTPENIELKNSVIELYNGRLDERIRRKKFVIERGLLNLKQVQKFERKKSKEDREIINKMKIFARFNSAEEHTDLVHSILKERLLRETIQQLKFFRSKGLTNMDQIEKFIETQKLKNKSQGNNYEKNYGTVSGRAGTANFKIQQMEDALGVVRNKEGTLGATSHKKKPSGHQSS